MLLCVITAQAQTDNYQPLVREGVVWHYAYHHFIDESVGSYATIQRLQFKGDTIINGVDYKKCYFYESEVLNENEKPLCCAREENGKVMFTAYRHEITDTLCELLPIFGIPGEHYEDNGEVMMFDFSDMQDFVDNINDQGDVYAQIQSTSEVTVNGLPAKSYNISVSGCYPCSFIEGIGSDGMNTGYLFAPFVLLSTGFGSWPLGLVKLTDLEGNTLYKGAYYDDFNTDEESDYQPLVREGVRWVNVHEAYREDYSCYFYNYEFRGDTIINGKSYKKCYKYTGKSLDLSKDTAYCAMRDEGYKVYEVPFNDDYSLIYYNSFEVVHEVEETGEFLLFDFDNPITPLYQSTGVMKPSGKIKQALGQSKQGHFVPGIGYDGEYDGDAFNPFIPICDCIYYDTNGFHHLEDLSGSVLYEGAAYDRTENVYAPLVREGVVWEYLYVNEDSTTSIERFQFVGDTIFSKGTNFGPTKFLKCFRYFEDELDTTSSNTTAYLQEIGRSVTVVTTPITTHKKEHFIEEFGWTYSYPDYWGFEITGAREIYNFNYMSYFMQLINELYGCNYFSANDSVVSLVQVGDQMNRCFDITGINIENGKWIEGVGIDGYHTGNLIQPLAVSGDTGTQGLIQLTDLNGNTLYKGAYYHIAYELPKFDLNHDGVIDIADINFMINVMLGYDVPTGNQGHDTMPAEAAIPIADVTHDGQVDISDVNAIINAMLGK